ncbi:MAG TPA: protein-tyrosine-phosphatase, partial [Bacteroidales bacterium]|nr:protein-tyrosine-phosphatase [Bacteroidales bacterium]
MKKILMVCLGNICRSPLAEGIMRKKLNDFNINAEVDSCGFESFHTGDRPDQRGIEVAQKNGIDISGHRARLFRVADFEEFDYIFVMDQRNYAD